MDPTEYDADTEAKENVNLEALYPSISLDEGKQTTEEVDLTYEDDLDLDILKAEEITDTSACNDNEDMPDKKKRRRVETEGAGKAAPALAVPQVSPTNPVKFSIPKVTAKTTSPAPGKVQPSPPELIKAN